MLLLLKILSSFGMCKLCLNFGGRVAVLCECGANVFESVYFKLLTVYGDFYRSVVHAADHDLAHFTAVIHDIRP